MESCSTDVARHLCICDTHPFFCVAQTIFANQIKPLDSVSIESGGWKRAMSQEQAAQLLRGKRDDNVSDTVSEHDEKARGPCLRIGTVAGCLG